MCNLTLNSLNNRPADVQQTAIENNSRYSTHDNVWKETSKLKGHETQIIVELRLPQ